MILVTLNQVSILINQSIQPTNPLVDIDNDGDLEIVVAEMMEVVIAYTYHECTEMTSFNTGDDIRKYLFQTNDDGSYEMVYSRYDDYLHVWTCFRSRVTRMAR